MTLKLTAPTSGEPIARSTILSKVIDVVILMERRRFQPTITVRLAAGIRIPMTHEVLPVYANIHLIIRLMYCSVVDRESWPLSVTPDKKNLSHLELTTSFNENVED